MKLADLQKCYQDLSAKASDLVRQLGFAALGVVWIFKTDTAGRPAIPRELMVVAALAILALTLDFLQYVTGSLIWGLYRRNLERKGFSTDREFRAPRIVNWPAIGCFWAKIATI